MHDEKLEKVINKLQGFEGVVALELGSTTIIGRIKPNENPDWDLIDLSGISYSSKKIRDPILVKTNFSIPGQDEYEYFLKSHYSIRKHSKKSVSVNPESIDIAYTL